MTECLYVVGDTRDVTAKLPDGSVDLVLTRNALRAEIDAALQADSDTTESGE